MTEEKVTLEFRFENIYKSRSYFLEEINQNELMSMKHTKLCAIFNYNELLLNYILCF